MPPARHSSIKANSTNALGGALPLPAMSVESPRPDSLLTRCEAAARCEPRSAGGLGCPERWKSVAAGFPSPADDYVEVGNRPQRAE